MDKRGGDWLEKVLMWSRALRAYLVWPTRGACSMQVSGSGGHHGHSGKLSRLSGVSASA